MPYLATSLSRPPSLPPVSCAIPRVADVDGIEAVGGFHDLDVGHERGPVAAIVVQVRITNEHEPERARLMDCEALLGSKAALQQRVRDGDLPIQSEAPDSMSLFGNLMLKAPGMTDWIAIRAIPGPDEDDIFPIRDGDKSQCARRGRAPKDH